jgi:uncharacterized membrane protein
VTLKRVSLVLAVIGVGVAGYLVYVHYSGIKIICAAGGGGCEKVQSSSYAELAGVPVALLGLLGYLGIVGALLFLPDETARLVVAFLALVGFGFSMYLTWAELFRIHAICQWCAGSAVLMTLLAIISVIRLVRYEDEPAPRAAATAR